ncbi:MAG: relaxase domain-containing protein [Actinobacteria bacterium]|nr:relaxase domain-containing protein [Actinomycetota bacterium]
MLNVGKLASGGEDYYLSQVATSVEEYYTGEGEAPGRWLGRASPRLGLSGEVDADELRAVLGGRDPTTGEALLSRPRKVPGFDLTFRAPKSVSLAWALSDVETSREVRRAHEAAVAAAVDYLERHAAFTRRGAGGAERVPVEGFVGAGFRHRASRAHDPLLHTHVLVPNLVYTPDDDTWRTLDGRQLYLHAKTAGYLYQAHLRHELTRRLGTDWGPVRNGYADIDGVPRDVIEAFSRRRSQILDELERVGQSSARAAQVATLATRPTKTAEPAGLREQWQRRAAQLDFDDESVADLTGRTTPPQPDRSSLRMAAEDLLSEQGLTARASTFTRRDALQAWCLKLPLGAEVADIERLADHLLEGEARTVRLSSHGSDVRHLASAGIRLRDGRLVAVTERRYSTLELLALEQQLVEQAVARRDAGVATVDPAEVERCLAGRSWLSDQQAEAVHHLTQSGDGVAVVVGRAGSGKTSMLGAARAAWERAGIPVVGCALAARAALELQNGAAIPSMTIARLLADIQRPGGGLPAGGVLVIDEAAMVGTRTLARFLDEANQIGTKVVLVGDHHQLPEIDAGGAFAGLVNRLPAIELTDNRRQQQAWERDALDELRDGNVRDALDAYLLHDRVVVGDTAAALREQLVGDWWQAVAEFGDDALMIAARRVDIDDLNARAREHLTAAGELHGPALIAAGREFHRGDRILCLRNHRSVGVLNGTRGTVTRIDHIPRSLTFTRDDTGESVVLPTDYLDAGWVDHGYALTAHKAQGLTCEATFVLADQTIYREWGYVALSRGRQLNRLYVVEDPQDPDPPDDPTHPQTLQGEDRPAEVRVAAELRRSHQQVCAIEHLPEASHEAVGETHAAEFDPPSYITRVLGARPSHAGKRRIWREAVSAVEAYREAQAVTDNEQPLGPRPDAPRERESYNAALRQLLHARRQIQPVREAGPDQARDLGVGLA